MQPLFNGDIAFKYHESPVFKLAISEAVSMALEKNKIPNVDKVEFLVVTNVKSAIDKAKTDLTTDIAKLPNEDKVKVIVSESKKHFLTFYIGAIVLIVTSILGGMYMFTGRIDSKVDTYTSKVEGKIDSLDKKYIEVVKQQSSKGADITTLKTK